MAKHILTMDHEYQAEQWGLWEAFRELVANSHDAEMRGEGKCDVSFSYGKGLRVATSGVKVPLNSLLMGTSTSRSRNECIGTFGEGLPMALLALARLELQNLIGPVEIYNQDEKWIPALEWSEEWNSVVLTIKVRKLRKLRPGFEVLIGGVKDSLWQEFRKLFLFADPEFDEEQTARVVNGYNRILLQPGYKGLVFVKGVFVERYKGLEYGYDLNVELNRDRHMMDEWDLKWTLSCLLRDLLVQQPEKFKDSVLSMLQKGTPETASAYAYVNSKAVVEAAVVEFEDKHGEEAIPCQSMEESRELEFFGKKGIIVNDTLSQILQQRKGTFEDAKNVAQQGEKEVFGWHDLDEVEKACLVSATDAVQKVVGIIAADYEVLNSVSVVEFRDPNLLGLYEAGKIKISRSVLSDKRLCLKTLVHEVAHLGGKDGEYSHGDIMVDLLVGMVNI
jgi:hypothetical protein